MKLLYTSQYVKPGTYMANSPEESETFSDIRNQPLVIGKGSRLVNLKESVIRGYIYDEIVEVSPLYPNIFSTMYPFLKKKSKIRIYRDGSLLGGDDYIIIDDSHIQLKNYLPDVEYQISYPSTNEDVSDKITLDVIQFLNVYGKESYTEFEDYYLEYRLTNLILNNQPTDVIKFSERYESLKDYPYVKNYIGTDSLLIKNESNVRQEINGYVSRIEYNASNVIKFIVLTLEGDIREDVIVYNDSKYHYCDNIGYKIVGDDFESSFVTKENVFIRDDGNTTRIHFYAMPEKLMIENPEREIYARVIQSNPFEFSQEIKNVKCEYRNNIYTKGAIFANVKYVVRSLDIIVNGDGWYLPFEISDGTGSVIEYVPVTVSNNIIYLKDRLIFTTKENIRVVVPENDFIWQFSDDSVLGDSDGNILAGGKYDIESISIKSNSILMEFEYECKITSEPTILSVSNSFNSDTQLVNVYDDFNEYSLNDIKTIIDVNGLSKDDYITFKVENAKAINWNLTREVSDVFTNARTDYSGSLTGEQCAKYLQLSGVPITDVEIESSLDFGYQLKVNDGVAYIILTRNGIPLDLQAKVTVSYRTENKRPEAGTSYVINCLCVRPESMYNSVIHVGSYDEGVEKIGPFEKGNDLWMANEVAWNENVTDFYYIQIKDSDGDGVVTDEDVSKAIDALEKSKIGTDIVLLNCPESINKIYAFSERSNSVFNSDENKVWLGFAEGTDVDTLIDYAERMQYGGFGRFRAFVPNTWCTVRINRDGQWLTVRLNGSFVAWALACHRTVVGFSESLLSTTLSLTDVQTYEDNDVLKFGDSNCFIVGNVNNTVKVIEDKTLKDIEQVVNQQVLVCRALRKRLDDEIPGTVVDTPVGGISLIRSKLVSHLTDFINKKVISNYLDDTGSLRLIDPDKDVYVDNVTDKPTQYIFGFGFFTKKGIKHLFGSYVVDKDLVR